MIIAFIGLVLLVILVLIAIHFGINKEKPAEIQDRSLSVSGIYSIVRRSPREEIMRRKPPEEEIRKYLSEINEDIGKLPLSDQDRHELLDEWRKSIRENIATIEEGDSQGVGFYYFNFPGSCPVCKPVVSQGQFVTREEIYEHPEVIPPLHLGCTCRIHAHHGKENLRETTELGMLPLFDKGKIPVLPDWKKTIKLSFSPEVLPQ